MVVSDMPVNSNNHNVDLLLLLLANNTTAANKQGVGIKSWLFSLCMFNVEIELLWCTKLSYAK